MELIFLKPDSIWLYEETKAHLIVYRQITLKKIIQNEFSSHTIN